MIKGAFVTIDNETYYKVDNYNEMRPFFISLVSHTDLWLFISTTGGLSAGRVNENGALFPYYTDDKLEDNAENTGSKTIVRMLGNDKPQVWEPFSIRSEDSYQTERNLYKTKVGNQIIFEEINFDLGLTFRYWWRFSAKFGIVKTSEIINNKNQEQHFEILDGFQNLLPYGVGSGLQTASSNLVNAYKKNELEPKSGLGLFVLSSMIVDKAEPAEALKATTAWTSANDVQKTLLSSVQLGLFRRNEMIHQEEDVRAERGAYFVVFEKNLSPQTSSKWDIVAEVNQDHRDVVSLINRLSDKKSLRKELNEDILDGTTELQAIVCKADGVQCTDDELSTNRHYANVLFNVMRGGIFEDGYDVYIEDFVEYLKSINRVVFSKFEKDLIGLGAILKYQELLEWSIATHDKSLIRICYEYLPLSFSRRHGDPSRPWNKFSINTRKFDGSKNRDYQGNWRDIFQNWEALSLSYPSYILSMITKFVNASTLDGYNPYRITRDGIDWEVIEPEDPWSYIGYWGDHQIIYLLKLMEVAQNHFPEEFNALFNQEQFVYADVPYRIKPYKDIVNNPQDTIDFDDKVNHAAEKRTADIGGDGKLVFRDSQLLTANLNEKVLLSLLVKLSNFVPEGGIWMNTQRPEWNDANNALVGNGLSMVTLYYIRRYVAFYASILERLDSSDFKINEPLYDLFLGITDVFKKNTELLSGSFDNRSRKLVVDELGILGETYRQQVYNEVLPNSKVVSKEAIKDFLDLSLSFLDHSIEKNKREDGLYHSYNLLEFDNDELKVEYMYEMLEGQVSILSAGVLSMREALELLDALKKSKIYREDQYSYMLYPNRQLPRFLEKNNIPESFVEQSKLAIKLLEQANLDILVQDENGGFHFNGSFANAKDLELALDKLKETELSDLVDQEYQSYLKIFEQMFNHRAFTGRSGTFYGYEGLGSIYWHMVSKLLLSVQENILKGWDLEPDGQLKGRMIDHYYEIRAGIGVNKSPDLYGAIPTDPYSHTPGGKGAQQPGMTGQVKEDILNRWAELGISINNGCLSFNPKILNESEFLSGNASFRYLDAMSVWKSIELKNGELAFTYCQVPVTYSQSEKSSISVTYRNGDNIVTEGHVLDKNCSKEIFSRTGQIESIFVGLNN